MTKKQIIEDALKKSLQFLEVSGCPPRLAEAIRYAVFPGGARVRPHLTLAVAEACGAHGGASGDALCLQAAASVELMHCASLVHDDLPCFDDAATRRGRPSVHRRFGEPLAVLAGDALIVRAIEEISAHVEANPGRGAAVLRIIAAGVGACGGIIGGQGWECEDDVDLRRYQRAKTGALFEAAVLAGVAAVGAPLGAWRGLGEQVGEAYQIADDIADVFADPAALGKPVGQDRTHNRPSAVRELDVATATRRLNTLIASVREAVPPCEGRHALRERLTRTMTAHVERATQSRREASRMVLR